MIEGLLNQMRKAYESVRGEVCHVPSMEAAVEVVMPYIEESQKEMTRLRKYENIVRYIAAEPPELSHHKVELQRNHWKKLCEKLFEEDYI
jgi:hypothetical protein